MVKYCGEIYDFDNECSKQYGLCPRCKIEALEQEVERLKGENIEFRGLLLKFKDHFKSLKPVFSRDSAVCWINSLINKGE